MDLVCGVDEVGRGCVAGPLVAASAVFELSMDQLLDRESSPIPGIKDSKKFSSRKAREKVRDAILDSKLLYGYKIIPISAYFIDGYGIERANRDAMSQSVSLLDCYPTGILVDGVKLIKDDLHVSVFKEERQICLPKADDLFWPVGAASILAKCYRDNLMDELHKEYGRYGWDTNAGYGTEAHMAAIEKHGLTPFHRKTFLRKIEG